MAWQRSILPWLGPGILGGITAGDWWRLLRQNSFAISPRFFPRALVITGHALPNSALRAWENLRFGRRFSNVSVPPPIFLLGHWRNGTTLLHNLFSADTRWAFPTTYEAFFPHFFLTAEPVGVKLMELFLPKNRPMDNMEMGGKVPQEDEFALAVLSLESPLLGWVFQKRRDHYDRYLTFEGVSPVELDRWRNALRLLVRKLTWKHQRPLVLKSPPHTARIRLLLEMFPGAKFVHIHRDPFAVYQSSRHMFEVNFAIDGLQHDECADLEDWILRQYRNMYDAFFSERHLIPPGDYCEVRYESLVDDPIAELRRVYGELGLPEFESAEAAVRRHVAGIGTYKKNQFARLPDDLRDRIVGAWRPCFDEWNYPLSTDRAAPLDASIPAGRR